MARPRVDPAPAANVERSYVRRYLWWMLTTNIEILNLTSPVGFTEAAVAALRATDGVYSIEGTPDSDGRYRNLWLHVTANFNRAALGATQRVG